MAGVNKVTLLGHLGKDPEVRTLNNGGRVVNLRLATSETWKDKHSGERKERTEWHTVVIWNEGLGGVAERYLKKGSKVYVEGQLQTRSWEKDGIERYSTEVVLGAFNGTLVMLDGQNNDRQGDDSGQRQQGGNQSRHTRPAGDGGGHRGSQQQSFDADLDDQIPF